MTLEQGAHLAEIVGVIVVVVTLIYLSVQVRQGTELLRSESRQAQVTNDQDGVYKFVEHPELGRLFSQVETPSFTEKTKLNFWLIGQMRAREHEWLQYKDGILDETTWLTYRNILPLILASKRQRTWFRGLTRRGIDVTWIGPEDRDALLSHSWAAGARSPG